MSKLGRAVKRFEELKIGANKDVEIKCFGLNGKDTEKLFELIDKKDTKSALRFIVMTTLQKDDNSTTDEDYNNADLADIITIANKVTEMSGMGALFKFDEKKGLNTKMSEQESSENESKLSRVQELREKLATGQI